MPKLFPSNKIYVAQSKVVPAERGVFAKSPIKKGDVIETCPVIEISQDDTAAIHEESLVTYMFYYGKTKEKALIALGFGSLYNHTATPNAAYSIKSEEQVIEFLATADIKKDEEITVSYAKEDQNKRPLWFSGGHI